MSLIKTMQTAIVSTEFRAVNIPSGITEIRSFSLWADENFGAYGVRVVRGLFKIGQQRSIKMFVKKIITVIVFLSLCFICTALAGDSLLKPSIKTAVTSSGYTAVEVPSGVTSFYSYCIGTFDLTAFYLSPTGSDADAVYYDAGERFCIAYKNIKTFGTGTVVLAYAKGTTSTNIVGPIE